MINHYQISSTHFFLKINYETNLKNSYFNIVHLSKLPEPKRNFKTTCSERKDYFTFYLLQKVVESQPQ